MSRRGRLHARGTHGGLAHHPDRGAQYLSIRYTERLAEAGLQGSASTVGDSYDNALAETINGLYEAELIGRMGPWRTVEASELATLDRVHWFARPERASAASVSKEGAP